MTTDKLSSVFIAYGQAMLWAQNVEQSLVTLLIMSYNNDRGRTPSELANLETLWSKKPLNTLIEQTEKRFGTPSQRLGTLLQETRQRRNYLVHGFFYSHAESLAIQGTQGAILSELREINALFKSTAEELTAVIERAITASGMPPEEYRLRLAQMEAAVLARGISDESGNQ
jgi:hypothetical protein